MVVHHGSLDLRSGHACGHCEVAFVRSPAGDLLLASCGSDGRLAFWREDARGEPAATASLEPPLRALAADPRGGAVLVADGGNFATRRSALDGSDLGVLTRSSLPVRAVEPLASGTSVLVAGDEEGIKMLRCSPEAAKPPKRGAAESGSAASAPATSTAPPALERTLPARAYTRGLAADPEGRFAASVAADGSVTIWDLLSGSRAGALPRGTAPKIDALDETAVARPSWHPDGGSCLAVPLASGGVALLERLSWEVLAELTADEASGGGSRSGKPKGEPAAATVASFSPNGLYLAAGFSSGLVCVWDSSGSAGVEAHSTPVSSRRLPGAVTSLAWCPSRAALAVGTEDGEVGVWERPLPADAAEPFGDPAEGALDAEKAAGAGDGRGDGGRAAGQGRGGLGGDEGGDGEGDDDEGEEDDDGSASGSESDASEGGRGATRRGQHHSGHGHSRAGSSSRHRASRLFPSSALRAGGARLLRPQPCVTPGATPRDGDGNRFLCWNETGYVTRRILGPGEALVEAAYHDAQAAPRRPPVITDVGDFALAGLSYDGMVVATGGDPSAEGGDADADGSRGSSRGSSWRRRGEVDLGAAAAPEDGAASLLQFVSAHGASSSWTTRLPGYGERALSIAAGAGVVAVVTSLRRLHVLSAIGLPLACIELPGEPVGVIISGRRLAVVWAPLGRHALVACGPSGAPRPTDPPLRHGVVLDPAAEAVPLAWDAPLPLSPGARLEWMGFSSEGAPDLITFDDAGALRVAREAGWGTGLDARRGAGAAAGFGAPAARSVLLPQWQLVAVCRGPGDGGRATAEVLRVASASAAGARAFAVLGGLRDGWPAVPRPGAPPAVLARVEADATPCAANASGAGVTAEAAVVGARLRRDASMVMHSSGAGDEASGSAAPAPAPEPEPSPESLLDLDKALLRAIAALAREGRVEAAAAAAAELSGAPALEGARRLAAHHRLGDLERRIDDLLEDLERRQMERDEAAERAPLRASNGAAANAARGTDGPAKSVADASSLTFAPAAPVGSKRRLSIDRNDHAKRNPFVRKARVDG